ncbi:MAG: hypothetical protein J0M24_23960 [Verrucomicrobia bacterium]|nr:hypothetical protein [Verrucomicrobiota bacterium]
MQRLLQFLAASVFLSAFLSAQIANPLSKDSMRELQQSVKPIDGHSTLHERVLAQTGPSGESILTTNRFVELATGLNHWQDDAWLPSEEVLNVENGEAVGLQGQHKVWLPGQAGDGSLIRLKLPTGELMQSMVFGIGYYDPTTGQSVLLAEAKPAPGVLYPPNQVLYEDAFDTLKAALRYTYTKTGFEQDVILGETPPSPKVFGLSEKSRLEVWTEFLEAPEPEVEERVINEQAVAANRESAMRDHRLTFGTMRMDEGRAFPKQADDQTLALVSKEWVRTPDQRQFLVEAVVVDDLKPGLEALPPSREGANLRRPVSGRLMAARTDRPRARPPGEPTREIEVASTDKPETPGLVVDYILNGGSPNVTFYSGTTYHVTGPFNATGSQTIFEPGVIFKYKKNVSARLNIATPISWLASAYRPVVFTAEHDNTIGAVVATGTLTGYYADPALEITTSSSFDLKHFRITHAKTALKLSGAGTPTATLWHGQFVNSETGLLINKAATVRPRNILFHNVVWTLDGTSTTAPIQAEHLTVNTATLFNKGGFSSLTVANSILAGVATLPGASYSAVSGSVVTPSNPTTVFQVSGAGRNYLPTTSAYRNVGLTTINTQLRAELAGMTTEAPTVYSGSLTTWNPVVARDSNTPDYGYHYQPIDFAINHVPIVNTTLNINPGVTIAKLGTNNLGIRLTGTANLCAKGTPTSPINFTRYTAIQEQPEDWNGSPTLSEVMVSVGTTGTVGLRFCSFHLNPHKNDQHSIYVYQTPANIGRLLMRDCDLFLGNHWFFGPTTGPIPRLQFINNIFESADVEFYGQTIIEARNNLFRRGNLMWLPGTATSWAFQDNLIDSAFLIFSENELGFVRSHNAYYNIQGSIPPLNGTEIQLSTLTYASATYGSFTGRYYTGGNAALVDRGSRVSDQARLRYYTTVSINTPEQNSLVDIGFHYVALNGSGVAPDSNGNGTIDYLEELGTSCDCEYNSCANLPVAVALTSPLSGQLFLTSPTNIIVNAIASDPDGAIQNVKFYINGSLVFTDTAAPYQYYWDNVMSGPYTIYATATPVVGTAVTTPNVGVTVYSSPTISIIEPTTVNSVLPPGSSVTFKIAATAPNTTVSKVELYTGIATLVGQAAKVGEEYWVTINNLANGSHYFYARVTDELNRFRDSEPVIIQIINPGEFPTSIVITAPTPNAQITEGSSVVVKAAVSTSPSIARVEFYDEDELIETDYQAPYAATFTPKAGPHKLVAKAYTTAVPSKNARSAPVSLSVNVPGAASGPGYWETYGIGAGVLHPIGQNDIFYDLIIGEDGTLIGAHEVWTSTPEYDFLIAKLGESAWFAPEGREFGGLLTDPSSAITGLKYDGVYYASAPNGLYYWTGMEWQQIFATEGTYPATCPSINTYAYLSDAVLALVPWRGDIIAGGAFNLSSSSIQNIARISTITKTASSLGVTLNGRVRALLVLDDILYVGGEFTAVNGDTAIAYLAKYDGTSWSAVPQSGLNGSVWALAEWQGKLVIGGRFTTAGGSSTANGIALWDGSSWSTVGRGVSGQPDLDEVAPPVAVMALASRGLNLYVGGRFTNCLDYNGVTNVVNNVAEAIWDVATQKWTWRSMDGGVNDGSVSWIAFGSKPSNVGVHALVVQEGQLGSYDVVAAGCFEKAGSLLAANIARWRVGTGNGQGVSPLVTITVPSASSGFVAAPGQSVQVHGIAFTSGQAGHRVTTVKLYGKKDDGNPEPLATDEAYFNEANGSYLFNFTWSSDDLGRHQLWVVATQVDENNAAFSEGTSPRVVGTVKNSSTTLPSSDDFIPIVNEGRTVRLDVLANDQQPATRRITGVRRYTGASGLGGQPATLGVVRPTADGRALEYSPRPGAFGQDVFYYESKEGSSSSVAAVVIQLSIAPLVSITSPTDEYELPPGQTSVNITGMANRRDAPIGSIKCYRNGTLLNTIPNPSGAAFSFSSGTLAPGWHIISVVATDNRTPVALSSTQTVTIRRRKTGTDTPPIAKLINLANPTTAISTVDATDYPIVREGMLALTGDAYDPDNSPPPAAPIDALSYSIQIHHPGGVGEPLATLTPGTLDPDGFAPLSGNLVNGSLGVINLARIPNGVYDLWLIVRGGPLSAVDVVRIAVDSELKLGRLTFSEQDTLIPVNGIPLSLIRTYDSFDPESGDFGPSWRYSLMDLGAQFDEVREDETPFLELGSTGADTYTLPPISVRSGGGYNLSLTLPGGERTTFVFTPRRSNTTQLMFAEWKSAPGVDATLTIEPEDGVQNTINFYANGLGNPVWNGGDVHIPFERYDIPKLRLTTADGTEFYLERSPSDAQAPHYFIQQTTGKYAPVQPRPGPIRLTKIKQPTGDQIVITPNAPGVDGEIAHLPANSTTATRKLTFKRDDRDRIIEIRDPATLESGSPVAIMKYTYDPTTGNLIQVHRLINRTTATYATTTYHYDHPRFPHYLTAAVDPRGVQVARTDYDDSGRLNSVVDSTGRTTTYTYPTSGFSDSRTKARVESRDHEQNLRITEADQFGNVVYSVSKGPPPSNLQLDAIRRFTYGNTGFPNRLTQEETTVRDPANSSGTLFSLLRDYDYNDSDNPLFPTSVTDWHVLGTPSSLLRTRKVIYDKYGQVTQQIDPLYSSGTTVHTDTTYDSITHQPLIQSFTGTVPLGNSKTLSQNVYYPLTAAPGQAGRLNYSLDANNNAIVYEYATSTLAGSYRVGDLLSVTAWENGPNVTFLSKTSYTYDANGNVRTEIQRNSSNVELRRTTYEYDVQNRRIKTIDAMGGVSEQKFNLAGQAAQSIDRYGYSTYTFYDRLNAASCIRNPDDTYQFTLTYYTGTPAQRVVVRTDRALVSSSVAGAWSGLTATRTYYDALGRAVKTERVKDLALVESTGGSIKDLPGVLNLNLICDVSLSPSPAPTVLETTQTEYYDDGRVWRTIDAGVQVTTYTYSSDGLTRTTKPPSYSDGGTVTTDIIETSDLNGNLIYSQTKSYLNGSVQTHRPQTRYYYDQLNRRLRTRIATNESVTDDRTGTDTSSHGTLVSSTDYDWAGQRIREADADGVITKFDYDGASRLKQVTLAESTSDQTLTQYKYDELGQLESQTDANQVGQTTPKRTFFAYDKLGRRTGRTLPLNQVESWDFDFDTTTGATVPATVPIKPNRVRHKDFTGLAAGEMLLTYDAMGRPDLKRKKVGSSWVTIEDYDYAPGGQRSQMQDNLAGTARTTKYAYDHSGRLKVKQMPEGTVSYAYSAAGDLSEVSARHKYTFTGSTPWLFNALQQTQNNRTVGAQMSYEFDPRHRLSKVYGNLNLVGQNWVPSDLRATYSYDPVGNLAKVTYGPGTPFATTKYTYNTLNQLRFLTTKEGTTTNTICSFDYDDADNLSPGDNFAEPGDNFTWPAARRLTTSGFRRGAREVIGTTPMRQVGYSYDPLKRLTREGLWSAAFASESSAVQFDGTSGYTDTAGYDKVGNRRGRTIVNSFPVVTGRTYADYDANDRLGGIVLNKVAASWDANGNTLRFDLNGDGAWDNAAADDVYDLENRLITASRPTGTVSFVYDGDGNRVKKSVGSTTTYYLVDDRNPTGYSQVLEELSSLTAWPLPAPTVRYVYGSDLLHQDRAGTLRYYGYDGLGSVRCLFSTSPTPTVTDTYTYDAFGLLIARYARRSSDGVLVAFADPASETSAPAGTTPVQNNYRYTGEQWDPDLGMYYLRARYYHPDFGRFWNMDTFEGSQSDPLSLHKYLYVHSNPVNGIDPSGHEFTLANVSISSGMQSVLSSAASGAAINSIGNALIFGETSARQMLWNAGTGALMGGSGGLTKLGAKSLVGRIGLQRSAQIVLMFGPAAVNAFVATAETIVKEKLLNNEDLAPKKVAVLFAANFVLNVAISKIDAGIGAHSENARKAIEGMRNSKGNWAHGWAGMTPAERRLEQIWLRVSSDPLGSDTILGALISAEAEVAEWLIGGAVGEAITE